MSCDYTYVRFSNCDGHTLNVNRYYLEIFNEFYKDLLVSHGDVLHQLIFIHEDLSRTELQSLVQDIQTKHDYCERRMLQCEKEVDELIIETCVEQTSEGIKGSSDETLYERKNDIAENHRTLELNLKCPYCADSDKDREWTADNLIAHLYTKHNRELKTNFSVSFNTFLKKLRKSVSNSCALGCGKFKDATHLVEHYKSKHMDDPVVCDHCGQSFQNNRKLKYHLRAHGSSVVCEICNKVCGNLVKLRAHKRYVHNGKPFSCTYENCTMTFRTTKDKRKHVNGFHEKLKPFICEVCGVSMTRFPNLSDHRRKVHKIGKYSSIHHYRELISSGKHPFIKEDSSH